MTGFSAVRTITLQLSDFVDLKISRLSKPMVFKFKISVLSIRNLAISLFPLTALSANWHTSHVRLTKYRMFERSLFRTDYSLFCRT